MSAVALLARARDAGVDVRVHGGDLRLRGKPDADLFQAIREAKPALVAILRGDTCRWCGEPMSWPGPAGVVEAAGTATASRLLPRVRVRPAARLWSPRRRIT